MKHDPYASEEDTRALLRKDERTPAEKKLDRMLDERGAWEQGAEPFLILRQIALELLAEQPAQQEFICSTGLCHYKAQQQEPVAWMWMLDGEVWDLCSTKDRFQPMREGHVQVPLYTSPPASKPLTDEQIKKLAAPLFMTHYWKLCNEFARAIEAAHGITKGGAQ